MVALQDVYTFTKHTHTHTHLVEYLSGFVPSTSSHVSLETPIVETVDVLENAVLVSQTSVRTGGGALVNASV